MEKLDKTKHYDWVLLYYFEHLEIEFCNSSTVPNETWQEKEQGNDDAYYQW